MDRAVAPVERSRRRWNAAARLAHCRVELQDDATCRVWYVSEIFGVPDSRRTLPDAEESHVLKVFSDRAECRVDRAESAEKRREHPAYRVVDDRNVPMEACFKAAWTHVGRLELKR